MLKQLRVVSTNSVNGQLFLTALLICQCSVCCQSRRPCSVFRCWHRGYANEHMNQLSPPQTPCVPKTGECAQSSAGSKWLAQRRRRQTSVSWSGFSFLFSFFYQESPVCFHSEAFIRFQSGSFNLFLSKHNRRQKVRKWETFQVRELQCG